MSIPWPGTATAAQHLGVHSVPECTAKLPCSTSYNTREGVHTPNHAELPSSQHHQVFLHAVTDSQHQQDFHRAPEYQQPSPHSLYCPVLLLLLNLAKSSKGTLHPKASLPCSPQVPPACCVLCHQPCWPRRETAAWIKLPPYLLWHMAPVSCEDAWPREQ